MGALIGRNNGASLTILDDDVYTPPTLNFSAADYTVGEATATKSITVKRTGDSTGTVTADWSARLQHGDTWESISARPAVS